MSRTFYLSRLHDPLLSQRAVVAGMLNWELCPVPLSAPVLFWACAANLPINSPTPKNISGSLPDSSDVVVYIFKLGKVEVGGQILNVLLLQLFFSYASSSTPHPRQWVSE